MAKHRLIVTKLHLKPKLNLPTHEQLLAENAELRARLRESEETLRAIQSGDVDAVVVSGPKGEQVFALKGAEYAYRALVEAMNEGAATISADGIVLYCNKQVALLLQLPAEKVIGNTANALVAEADKRTFAALFQHALAGEAGTTEVRFQIQDGSTVPAYVSLSRLPEDGLPAVCMVITDLREHKKRDELIAAGNLAQSILEHAAEAIAVCNEQGRIILANEALRTLCGRTPQFEHFDHVLPLEVVARRGSGEPASWRFSVSSALEGKSIKGQEVIYRRNDDQRGEGRTSWLLLSAGPLRSGDHSLGCVLTLMDITKRKAAERALLRSEKLAATGQLAATIAHEINNPLTAIFNLLYLIEQEPKPEEAQKLVTQALGELSRVSHIAKQTLAFYRESSEPEKINLGEVLDDVLLLFRKELQARKVSVEKKYEVPGEVHAFAGEMRQVFSNLLRNSIEAVPEKGHIRLLLRRSRRGAKEGVGVFISDNGSGIRPEIRSKIFEPFFTTKQQRGTGLGLWVARDLVEKHGGVIRLRSSTFPGRVGTCFFVFLPLAAKKQAPARKDDKKQLARVAGAGL